MTKYTNKSLERIVKNITFSNVCPTLTANCMQSINHQNCVLIMKERKKERESVFTEMERAMFTEDGNVKRYLDSNIVDKFDNGQMATLNYPNGYGHGTRVHNESVALTTGQQPAIKSNLRIRKLVPLECLKLMGFTKSDYDDMRKLGMSDSAIYHIAGDSIITTCLVGLLAQFVEKDHAPIIEKYIEKEILK